MEMDNTINNFILYRSSKGEIKVEVYAEDETVWMTQKAMSILFGGGKQYNYLSFKRNI